MKPMGGHRTQIENNCQDWKVKGKAYKKYKHQERMQAKKQIKKAIKLED